MKVRVIPLPREVTITYFKKSGKYYTTEEAMWPSDDKHYTGWAPFEEVVRLRDMYAVCMESPMGFPVFCHPQSVSPASGPKEG
jgi:hypothetical protein